MISLTALTVLHYTESEKQEKFKSDLCKKGGKKKSVSVSISSLLLIFEVMSHGKKLAKETLLPSVLEDNDAESEKLQLGEVGKLTEQPSLHTVGQV